MSTAGTDISIKNGRIKITLSAASACLVRLDRTDVEEYIDACRDRYDLARIEHAAMYHAQHFGCADGEPWSAPVEATARNPAEIRAAGNVRTNGGADLTCSVSAEIDMPVPLQAVLNTILAMPSDKQTDYKYLMDLAEKARGRAKELPR